MKVITAPEQYTADENDISCFLAGGITNCATWQNDVIKYLRKTEEYGLRDLSRLIVFNPRREDFSDFSDAEATLQIKWEFTNLSSCDIFSMYFASGSSVQPISLYELGRNLALKMGDPFRVIVSMEDGYSRAIDVITQTRLATDGKVDVLEHATPQLHAKEIIRRYALLENIYYNV